MRLQKTCNHLGREVSPISLPVLPPLFDSLGNFGCICRLEIGLSVFRGWGLSSEGSEDSLWRDIWPSHLAIGSCVLLIHSSVRLDGRGNPHSTPFVFLRTHLRASFCAGRWCGINWRANRILENKEKYDLEEWKNEDQEGTGRTLSRHWWLVYSHGLTHFCFSVLHS